MAIRLLPGIGFGSGRYPEKVARRLRTLTFAAWIAAATHALYAAALLYDVARFWWPIVANAVAMLLYAGVPLLYPFGRLTGPVGIHITGDSGAGTSTLGAALAARLRHSKFVADPIYPLEWRSGRIYLRRNQGTRNGPEHQGS